MPASSVTLAFEAGVTFRKVLQIIDETSGDPLDLTDYDPITTSSPLAAGGSVVLRETADTISSSTLSLTVKTNIDHEGIYILQPPTLGQVQILIAEDTLAAISYDLVGDTGAKSPRSGTWNMELGGVPAVGDIVQEIFHPFAGPWSITAENTRVIL